jgi:hypothetical protein
MFHAGFSVLSLRARIVSIRNLCLVKSMPVAVWIAIFVSLYITIFLPLMTRKHEEENENNA